MSCNHLNFRVGTNIQRVVRYGEPDDTAPVAIVMELSVVCTDCDMPFIFNWTSVANPDVPPLNTTEMLVRPWVDPFRQTLGVTITPSSEGLDLMEMGVAGNA